MSAGGGGGSASLIGSGTPALFYFYQGQLTVYDPNGNSFPYRPLINTVPAASGCSNFGALQFVQGTSTNKCASYSSFQLQSNQQDSQLGAELVFNFTGGFYACNGGAEVSLYGLLLWLSLKDSSLRSGIKSIRATGQAIAYLFISIQFPRTRMRVVPIRCRTWSHQTEFGRL